MNVTANATLNGHDLTDVTVLNPGAWFGKCWLLEIGGSYWPLFLIVEAENVSDAIDELAESETYGHHIVVPDEDLGDYDLESCLCGPIGRVLDLDHLVIHGREGAEQPFPCRYFGEGLPAEGIEPKELDEYDLEEQA